MRELRPIVKVRLKFNDTVENRSEAVVNMQSIPRVGEFLVSGGSGMRQILQVVHTPEIRDQDVIVELVPARKD